MQKICENEKFIVPLRRELVIFDYLPYGELIDNQQASRSWYDERYKFTGKERDWETGLLRANELITYSPIVLNYHKINLLKKYSRTIANSK